MSDEIKVETWQEAYRATSCRIAVIFGVLVEAGLCSEKAFENALAVVEAAYDQRQAKADAKAKAENPLAGLCERLGL